MDGQSRISKRDGGAGLSLAALLAIAVGGGVLLFSTIGLLMAWHLKHRQRRVSTRAFTLPDEYSQTKLTKRPLIMTESAVSGSSTRMASRFSLTMPPVLPLPIMPTYNSLKWFFLSPAEKKKNRRPRSWIGGDDFHAPHVYRDVKDDSWLGWGPTVPSLALLENGKAKKYEHYTAESGRLQKPPLGKSELVVQKHRRDTLPPSQTAPAFHSDAPRGRQSAVRVPAQAHVRPSMTTMDMGLREILQSTDQRLRQGASRSPVKTPQGSPTRGSQRGSPVKTPHSHRSNSSRGTDRGYHRKTPSPTKSGNLSTSSTVAGDAHSRNVSTTSIGSAANSLLAEATQQLELPGGKASPSRLQGREWEPYGDQILPPSKTPLHSPHHSPRRSPQKSPERRSSYESDQSSSLSTLYSVGDDEAEVQPQYNINYPIGQAISKYSWQAPQEMAPIHALAHRRSKTTSPGHIMAWQTENSPLNKPLRPLSVNAKSLGRDADFIRQPPPPQPVFKYDTDVQRREEEEQLLRAEIPSLPSDSSFTSESVHSTDSVQQSEPTCETPRQEWLPDHNNRRSPPTSPLSPEKQNEIGRDDMSSSPYSEEDIVAMLLESGGTKRALPVPPTMVTAPDGTVVPAGLSPRPSVRSDKSNATALLERSTSNASSVYSTQPPPARHQATTGSPTRRPTNRSRGQPQALSTTIAELRRMNSLVSSYSQASVASSTTSDVDSPTLPSLTSFNGGGGGTGVIAPRTQKAIGSKHYLNISKGPTSSNKSAPNLHKVGSGSRLPTLAKAESEGMLKPKRPMKSALRKPKLTQTPQRSPADGGKENRGVKDAKTPVAGPSPRVKDLRERASRESTPTGPSPKSSPASQLPKPKAGPVKTLLAHEKRRQEKRESVESLGLYDQDGFLLSSPDRDVRRPAAGLRT